MSVTIKLVLEKQTGRKPIDDNEADAYAVLKFTMHELGIEGKE